MSTTTDTPTGTCFNCGDEYELPGHGECCSSRCHYQYRGDKALNLLRHNHCVCPSCGEVLKEVSPPSNDWKHRKGSPTQVALDHGATLDKQDGQQVLDCTEVSDVQRTDVESVVGFQHRTPAAVTVEQTHHRDAYQELVGTGTGCECGTTDLFQEDEAIQDIELETVLANYVKRFWAFYDEGQLDQRLDKDAFFEAFREYRDLKTAVGIGLHG